MVKTGNQGELLSKLRDLMKEHNVQAYVVYTNDAHQVSSTIDIPDTLYCNGVGFRANILLIGTNDVNSFLASQDRREPQSLP